MTRPRRAARRSRDRAHDAFEPGVEPGIGRAQRPQAALLLRLLQVRAAGGRSGEREDGGQEGGSSRRLSPGRDSPELPPKTATCPPSYAEAGPWRRCAGAGVYRRSAMRCRSGRALDGRAGAPGSGREGVATRRAGRSMPRTSASVVAHEHLTLQRSSPESGSSSITSRPPQTVIAADAVVALWLARPCSRSSASLSPKAARRLDAHAETAAHALPGHNRAHQVLDEVLVDDDEGLIELEGAGRLGGAAGPPARRSAAGGRSLPPEVLWFRRKACADAAGRCQHQAHTSEPRRTDQNRWQGCRSPARCPGFRGRRRARGVPSTWGRSSLPTITSLTIAQRSDDRGGHRPLLPILHRGLSRPHSKGDASGPAKALPGGSGDAVLVDGDFSRPATRL
jgi:hypothetical protein